LPIKIQYIIALFVNLSITLRKIEKQAHHTGKICRTNQKHIKREQWVL